MAFAWQAPVVAWRSVAWDQVRHKKVPGKKPHTWRDLHFFFIRRALQGGYAVIVASDRVN